MCAAASQRCHATAARLRPGRHATLRGLNGRLATRPAPRAVATLVGAALLGVAGLLGAYLVTRAIVNPPERSHPAARATTETTAASPAPVAKPPRAPGTIALRMSDLPSGFIVDPTNTGTITWKVLATLKEPAAWIAALHADGRVAEYEASYLRVRKAPNGTRTPTVGIHSIVTTWRTPQGAKTAFDSPLNPARTLMKRLRLVSTSQPGADQWLEGVEHAKGVVSYVIRWRSGRVSATVIVAGHGALATEAFARHVARVSLLRARGA